MKILARRFADKMFDDHVSDDELTIYINLGISDLTRVMQEGHGHEFFLKCTEIAIDEDQTVYELPDDFGGVKRVDYGLNVMPAVSKSSGSGAGLTVETYDVPIYDQEDVYTLSPHDFLNAHSETHPYSVSAHIQTREAAPKYRILASKKATTVGNEAPLTPTYSHVDLIRLDRAASGYLYVWYWPKPARLSNDSDKWGTFMDFYEYPSLVAAKMMLDKEESDSRAIAGRIARVEESIRFFAANRDIEHEESVADVMGGYRG